MTHPVNHPARTDAPGPDGDHQAAVPVPARITIALDAAGLWGPQVDTDLGGREPMVDLWEAGIETPTREQIVRLAALTGMTPAFFYDPTPIEDLTGWVCLRRKTDGARCHRLSTTDRPRPTAVQTALF